MSEDHSARLGLPLLQPGQAQKEADHNEALALLDLAVQPVVEAVGVETPPISPAEGACWIVGAAPLGDWVGHAGDIAGWTQGGWRFVRPSEGMSAWSVADTVTVRFQGGSWSIGDVTATRFLIEGVQVIGARQASIAEPTGGVTSDAEARSAISEILSTLRAHGLIAT